MSSKTPVEAHLKGLPVTSAMPGSRVGGSPARSVMPRRRVEGDSVVQRCGEGDASVMVIVTSADFGSLTTSL
jgi:hypothetical protein